MQWYFIDDEKWNKVKTELLSWVGTPYMHMCGVKYRGTDCNQFIGASLTIVGILNGYEYQHYSIDWYKHTKEEIIINYLEKHREKLADGLDIVRLSPDVPLMRGDFLGFSIFSNVVNHAGILLDDGTFINSAVYRGVTIFEFNNYWKKHLKVVYRLMEE